MDELTEVRRHCHSLLTIDFVRLQVLLIRTIASCHFALTKKFYFQSYSDTQSTGTVNILGLSSIDELKEQNVLVSLLLHTYLQRTNSISETSLTYHLLQIVHLNIYP